MSTTEEVTNSTVNSIFLKTKEQAFVEACYNGEMDVIDQLIQEGIDVNCTYNKWSGLMKACERTTPWVLDVVTKLIVNGANVDHEHNGKSKWNAMDVVLDKDPFNLEVASLILDCSKLGINRLDANNYNYMIMISTIEACKFLIENGIDLNHVCNDRTALDDAFAIEIEEYLEQQGAKRYSEL